MEMIKVGIYLPDQDFARALSRGLAKECRRMNFFLMEEEGAEGFDLILSKDILDNDHAVRLVSDAEDECFDEGRTFSVFKYRDSQSFVNCLILAYFRLSGKMLEYKGHRKTKLVVFASASGGSGSTSLSISSCQSLRRLYGKKCLYLNLCPVNDAGKYLKMDEGGHLLKLLYGLNQGSELPLELFITEGPNLDFVSSRLFNSYFDQMQPEILHVFLQKLEKSGVYDILLCDIGNFICRGNKELLRFADCVAFIVREDYRLPGKYIEAIAREIREKMESGYMIPIINCSDSLWEESGTESAVHISFDTDAFEVGQDGLINICLTRNYGMEISVIAKKIIEEGDANHEKNI